jgi:hypothetical protein
LVKSNSTYEAEVAFVVSASLTQAELMVREDERSPSPPHFGRGATIQQ